MSQWIGTNTPVKAVDANNHGKAAVPVQYTRIPGAGPSTVITAQQSGTARPQRQYIIPQGTQTQWPDALKNAQFKEMPLFAGQLDGAKEKTQTVTAPPPPATNIPTREADHSIVAVYGINPEEANNTNHSCETAISLRNEVSSLRTQVKTLEAELARARADAAAK